MSKFTSWYKRMGFWQWIGSIVTPLAVTGEGAILTLHLSPAWHAAVIGSVVIAGFIKYNIKDDDNDGIADIFQR